MGKLKKPCKNAYFFFIMEEKEKHEAQGYRVPGGFGNCSQTFGHKWSKMSKEEKAPYEKMAKDAKEQEKYNVNNKFTVTGESYAQVHQKQMERNLACEQMERFVYRLTTGPEAGDRMIIFMKAVHCVEEIIDRKRRQYWPSELALVAFSLKGGIKSIYTQLVDTGETPTGYASQAKENCEETSLPMPGNRTLFNDECRDYLRILKNINGFANHWLKDGYDFPGHRKVFFSLDHEREPIISCLQWLVNQLKGKEKGKYQHFVNNLKVYKISNLVLSLAEEASNLNPSYDNYVMKFKLESAADEIVKKGNYDYREEIVCGYHRLDFASMKSHNCAQSIVMRRIFMLFLEFVPAYQYSFTERHKIDNVGKGIKGPIIKKKREKSPSKEEMKVEEPSWLKSDDMDTVDFSASASAPSSSCGAWGTRPAAAATFEDDDFPSLGACGGSNSSRGWGSCFTSNSRSPPSSSYSHSGSAGRGTRRTSSTSFMDDDDDEEFPSLSSSSRGRGNR